MTSIPAWAREAAFFFCALTAYLIFLPLLLAALAYQTRQAMFVPAYTSLYTYFFRYTLAACFALAAATWAIRYAVRRFRRRT